VIGNFTITAVNTTTATINNKFWEVLIACFPFTMILVPDTASKKKTLYLCVMKSIKQYNLGGCSVVITGGTLLLGTPLRWPQMARHAYQVSLSWFGHSENIKLITSTI
jgi:hypothetical protein